MSENCYRLLIFRYILLIAVGCYFYKKRRKTEYNLMFGIAGLIGLGFIILTVYIGYVPKIIYYWKGTSFLASLYIVPFAKKILTEPKFMKVHCEALERLGKASYHIYLVQMVYWYFLSKIVERVMSGRFASLIVGIIFCTAAGYLFYKIECVLTAKWKLKRVY